jgi:hypothetical protein
MSGRIALAVLVILAVSTRVDAQNAAAMSQLRRFEQQNQQQNQQQDQQQNQQNQQNQQQQQQQQQGQSVNVTGTIEQLSANSMTVVDSKNQTWQVQSTNETKMQLTGTADADFLKKDLVVEFTADLDAQGKGTSDVDKLSIVTASRDKIGVFASGKPVPKAKGIQPGAHSVVGHVKSFRDDVLIVHAGAFTVQVTLTDDPKIKVDMANLSYAAEGDKVTIRGLTFPKQLTMAQRMRQNQPNAQEQQSSGPKVVQAQDVKVELSETLTGGKKRATAKAATSSKSKTTSKAKQEDDSSDEK